MLPQGFSVDSHCSEPCITMCLGSSFSLIAEMAIGSLAIASAVISNEAKLGMEMRQVPVERALYG